MTRFPLPPRLLGPLGLALSLVLATSWVLPACSSSGGGTKRAVRIMPLGDSITQASAPWSSYRYWLWNQLRDAGLCVDFVGSQQGACAGDALHTDFDQDHEGHCGWFTEHIALQVAGWAQDAQPDVVLLHMGTNDLFLEQPEAEIAAELGDVIDQLRTVVPEVTILIAQLIPIAPGRDIEVEPLNALIPALVAAKDLPESRVVLVDQYTGFDAVGDTYDGVHPNETGEQKLATAWFQALQPLVSFVGGCGAGFSFCAGDGTAAPCPDGTASRLLSGEGCPNSTGAGALLLSEGTNRVKRDDLVLRATNAAPNEFGVFLQARSSEPGTPLGRGLSCLGSSPGTLEIVRTDGRGHAQTSVSLTRRGRVLPGDQRTYQFWFRDQADLRGLSNLSSGTRVLWH